MICEHPDMAARLRSEILEKVGTGKPTYDDIRDMKYLRAFLNGTRTVYYTPIEINYSPCMFPQKYCGYIQLCTR